MTALWRFTMFVLLCFITAISAPQNTDAPLAPVPTQILTGHKIFLANAASRPVFGVPNLTWNLFYAEMKSTNRFQIVATPEEADLVFEIGFSFLTPAKPTEVNVRISDPKTNVLLWQEWETVEPWNRDSTGQKNLETALAALASDLKNLATPPAQ